MERFDDEHLQHMYIVGLLDGDGEDDQRAARIVTRINNTVMNALRLSGTEVDNRFYQREDDALPGLRKRAQSVIAQSWQQMKHSLGW